MASYFEELGIDQKKTRNQDRREVLINSEDLFNSGSDIQPAQEIDLQIARQMFELSLLQRTNNGVEEQLINQLFTEAQQNNKGLSTSQYFLENLPTVIQIENLNDDGICSICSDNLSDAICDGKVVVDLPCHHQFDKECILPWLKNNNTCPVCRFELPSDEKKSDTIRTNSEPEESFNIDYMYG